MTPAQIEADLLQAKQPTLSRYAALAGAGMADGYVLANGFRHEGASQPEVLVTKFELAEIIACAIDKALRDAINKAVPA